MLFNYFYLFSTLILLSGFLVIVSRNPVQSVYFLILVFGFTAALFLVLGAEFLAVLLIIVYMGAISILFLFVVMMLNLSVMQLYAAFNNYFPVASFIGLFFAFQFVYVIYMISGFFNVDEFFIDNLFGTWIDSVFYNGNASYIGWVLYNFFGYFVLLAGLILLVSMIGVIVLTVDFQYSAVKSNDVYVLINSDITAVSFWGVNVNNKSNRIN